MEIAAGFRTADGWDISFGRFVMAFGNVENISDACTVYSDNRYSRILDLLRPGPQHLTTFFAAGSCKLSVAIIPADGDSVLGEGIDGETRERMIAPGNDTFMMVRTVDGTAPAIGASLEVIGSAEKLGRVVSFHWTFRQFAPRLTCDVLEMHAEETIELELYAVGSTLFRSIEGETRFDELAAADADGDGALTLLELDAIPTTDDHRTVAKRIYHGLLRELIIGSDIELCAPTNMPRPG
jgi:hypothetical protein